ncbi:MAG: hypothetical protein QOK39_481 [Acidimicrobiaceae bacterium]|nr:hypothetical protein [Acidimicrobiaceae bacterium]
MNTPTGTAAAIDHLLDAARRSLGSRPTADELA